MFGVEGATGGDAGFRGAGAAMSGACGLVADPQRPQNRSDGDIASPQDAHGRVSAMEYVGDMGVSPDPTDAAELAPEHCSFLANRDWPVSICCPEFRTCCPL
jgi:hypothetical protein